MAQLFTPPRFQAVDGNGNPYALANLYFYQTGTTTLQTVYADSAASTPLSNPVVADSNGLFPAIYLSNANLYKAILKDSAGNTIWTTDPINSSTPTPSYSPQGRLTLASGTPVMTSNQTAATTIYYTPYIGNQCPVWDGTQFASLTFAELTNATAQSSTGNAGPAAVTTNSNYDLFVWSNGGTATLTRGPAWSSDTSRGTGAGTTELIRISGVLVNAYAITNGPAANKGTYVGTVRSNASSQIDWILGGLAAGGTAAVLGVWNMYNRVVVSGFVGDTADSWTYTGASWHPARSQTTMRASMISGFAEDYMGARYEVVGSQLSGGISYVGVGYSNITAPNGLFSSIGYTPNAAVYGTGSYRTQFLGFNYFQALEQIQGANGTFYGDNGTGLLQTGLSYEGRF